MSHHNYKELKVWQKGMDLAELVYKITAAFPEEEKYGLTSQLRRCAVSIPSNISEGAGRGSNKEFKRFLEIALGSSNELDTQLILALKLNFITQNTSGESFKMIAEIGNMLIALIKKFDA